MKVSNDDHTTDSDEETNNNEVDNFTKLVQDDNDDPYIDADDICQDADENKSAASDNESDKESEFTDQHPSENLDHDKKDSDEQVEGRPKRKAAGAGVDRLEMRFDGKKYTDLTMKQFLQVTKTASQNSSERFFKKCVDIVFTQMNAKKGFRKYGKVAILAVIKEFRQLVHGAFPGKNVVKGVDPKTLTEEEKQQALDAVNLIKE